MGSRSERVGVNRFHQPCRGATMCHMPSAGGKREEDVKSITFDLYRFELPSRDELTISSTMRQAETQAAPFSRGEGKKGWPKFVTWLS